METIRIDRGDERGSASAMMLAVVILLVFIFLVVMALLSALGVMRKVQGAADVLALEAAARANNSGTFPTSVQACPSDSETMARFGVVLDECAVNHRGDVTIAVSAEVPAFHRKMRAVAVAGAR